jgi:hypothetical protein
MRDAASHGAARKEWTMNATKFLGKEGWVTLWTMGESKLVAAQPTRERCAMHNGGRKCQFKVRYYWARVGKRDVGYCTDHAVHCV